ncbi:unnamed protein product [Effrenium voratum]|nr:unnamed protein product [Effrenium voratum]
MTFAIRLGGTRVFALKGTSSWRDVYADIKLFATIEVFQALSKIVPILSLLPVPLVQSIVGYTGFSEANMWKVLEEAIDSSNPSDVTVVTGHSLGGLIAQIVAARKHLPALVFSSPGPPVDLRAASTATCHYLRKTACELWRGDLRGRDFSVTCDSYVAPEPTMATSLTVEPGFRTWRTRISMTEAEAAGREGESAAGSHGRFEASRREPVAYTVEFETVLAKFKLVEEQSAKLDELPAKLDEPSAKLAELTELLSGAPCELAGPGAKAKERLYLCFGCSEAAVLMNRASEISLAASALTPVTLGYFVADLVLLSQWQLTKGSKLEQYLMLTHHVASLLVWPAAIYFDWVARYVIIMLSYEMTSLLLTLLWMISAAGYKRSMAYGIIGLLFTSLFVVLRMIGAVPQLIGMYNAPPWSEELMQKLTGRVLHDYASLFSRSLVLPHLMNLFWGVKVVEGALSTFAGKKKTKCAEPRLPEPERSLEGVSAWAGRFVFYIFQSLTVVHCYRGHLQVARSLLQHRARCDVVDRGQRSPLHWAAETGQEALLDILLPCSLDAQDLQGWTPLMATAQQGHVATARRLLEGKASLEPQGLDGETAVMLAALNGHIEMLRLLVIHRADLNQPAGDGMTPLKLAGEAGHAEAVQRLLAMGAEVPPEGLALKGQADSSDELALTASLARQLSAELKSAATLEAADALARRWGFDDAQRLLGAVSAAEAHELEAHLSLLKGTKPDG